MSEPAAPYQVVYSGLVKQGLLALADEAAQRGDGEAYLAALKDFQHRLSVYPQFGDPLLDLTHEQGEVWVGVVPPLCMRYGLYEDRRLVMVTAPSVLLPKTGG